MTTIAQEMSETLRQTLNEEFSDESIKRIKKFVEDLSYELETDIEYRLKDAMSGHLSGHAHDMAKRTIEAILAGNESEMRRYLSCEVNGWTGRDSSHSVIHGTLFEHGAIALRKQIVDAHPELLKNERILDLEAQVRSLVEQVVKAEARAEAAYERFRAA